MRPRAPEADTAGLQPGSPPQALSSSARPAVHREAARVSLRVVLARNRRRDAAAFGRLWSSNLGPSNGAWGDSGIGTGKGTARMASEGRAAPLASWIAVGALCVVLFGIVFVGTVQRHDQLGPTVTGQPEPPQSELAARLEHLLGSTLWWVAIDDFTDEASLWATGENGQLKLSLGCSDRRVSVLLGPAEVGPSGRGGPSFAAPPAVDARWDDGDIEHLPFEVLDRTAQGTAARLGLRHGPVGLPSEFATTVVRKMAKHRQLRLRVRTTFDGIVSDRFDLTEGVAGVGVDGQSDSWPTLATALTDLLECVDDL